MMVYRRGGGPSSMRCRWERRISPEGELDSKKTPLGGKTLGSRRGHVPQDSPGATAETGTRP